MLTSSIIVIFITHFLSSLTGFGCTILAMPFIIPLVGIAVAKPILLVMGTLQPIYLVVILWKKIRWDIFKIILITAGLGIPFGLFLYSYLPQESLLVMLGFVMLIAGAVGIARTRGTHFNKIPIYILLLFVFIGGIIQGAFVSGGPLIVIYASLVLTEKTEFRATLSMVWVVLNGITMVNEFANSTFTPEVNFLILWNIPFLIVAIWLGNTLANKVSKKVFDYILNIVLFLGGIITITNQLA